MILILASRFDAEAAGVAARAGLPDVRVVTCQDLSRPGWRLEVGRPERTVVSVGSLRLSDAEVDGVIVRLSYVDSVELDHIAVEDREYVAAEMQAFLCAWLDSLGGRALNRPTPCHLGGPGWSRERWLALAQGLGLPVRRATVTSPVTVTVLRGRAVGTPTETVARRARRIAAAAQTGLLRVQFSTETGFDDDSPAVIGVDCWPDLATADVAKAIMESLTPVGAC